MQRLLFDILFLAIFSSTVFSQQEFDYYIQNNKRFNTGEKLTYSLKFGPLPAGKATITLNEEIYNDKQHYHAKIFARTTGLADKIYKIRDTYESYMDKRGMLPVMAVQDLKEGDYKFYTEMHFNHADTTVYSLKSDKNFGITEDAVDIVSLLYYFRAMNLEKIEEDEVIDINIFFDEEVLPFDFRYKGIETIKTSEGTFRCHRYDPVVIVGRQFESEDDLKVYFSADANYVPIRVKFELKIGSIKCDLIDYQNLKYKFRAER